MTFKYKNFIKKLEGAFDNLENSAVGACTTAEDVLIERTNATTPTLSHALINSRRIEITKNKNSVELDIGYYGVDYAIEQHEVPYNHDYNHNPSEVRSFRGGAPLRYLARPLIDERDVLWQRIADKVDWK